MRTQTGHFASNQFSVPIDIFSGTGIEPLPAPIFGIDNIGKKSTLCTFTLRFFTEVEMYIIQVQRRLRNISTRTGTLCHDFLLTSKIKKKGQLCSR